MVEFIYLTHKDQALGQKWFEISLNLENFENCQDIGTPFVPIDKNYLDKIAPTYFKCKKGGDLKKYGSVIGRFDEEDELLWKEHIAVPYRDNLERAKEIIKEIPADEKSGAVSDTSWLREGDVNIGGCYLDYCLYNTIETLRAKINNQNRRLFVVPELTACFEQPGNFTFQETLKELNFSPLKKIEIKHLDELLS